MRPISVEMTGKPIRLPMTNGVPYSSMPQAKAKKLPASLIEALRALERSPVFADGLGQEFVSAYVKLKTQDWQTYLRQLTPWEIETTIDC